MNKELDKLINVIEDELKDKALSRRDAMKLLGLGGMGLLSTNEELKAETLQASELSSKILIIGGGLAGISTASKLIQLLPNAQITILEPNKQSVSYQPGNTFIGAGLYEKSDVIYNTDDFIPQGVNLIYDKALEFDPDNNRVITAKNEVYEYDFLVVAAGLVLDFSKIKGLEELSEAYTVGGGEKITKLLANSGASTVYNIDAAVLTWQNMQALMKQAEDKKDLNAIFTHPNTAIKCGGAPKKMMYLMHARLNEAKLRDRVNMDFYANSKKMFSVKAYEEAIIKQFQKRQMSYHLRHNLIELNLKEKTVVFERFWDEKGAYDPDLEEHDIITKSEKIKKTYDFLHFAPPMKAAPEIGSSAIGSRRGWVPVNKETLQHVKYDNIFSLGDIAAVPLGKTGGSIRKQYKVVANNIAQAVQGKELTHKYDGYTVCPIITDIGKVMLAEFDWSMKPTPSFPLDPTQERYIWWLLKAYILKPMTQYGMLSGRA